MSMTEIIIISKKGINKTYKTKEKDKSKALIKILKRFRDEHTKVELEYFDFEGIVIK